jgi:hypothetical protein
MLSSSTASTWMSSRLADKSKEEYPMFQCIKNSPAPHHGGEDGLEEEKPCQPGQERNTLRGCGNAPLRSTFVESR